MKSIPPVAGVSRGWTTVGLVQTEHKLHGGAGRIGGNTIRISVPEQTYLIEVGLVRDGDAWNAFSLLLVQHE